MTCNATRFKYEYTACLAIVLPAWFSAAVFAQRINHEGRILGDLPPITNAILFNTQEADVVVSALQVFPTDNAWNEDISYRPNITNSDAMIAQISSDLLSSRQTLRAFYEMNFVLIPTNQPYIPIDFFNYPDESDPSPYPIPSNMPIETWPLLTGTLTLEQWQEDINNDGGDRHSIIVQPESGLVWETWLTKRVGPDWQASNGARFDMNSNALRPDGWTSADAAGLCMFGGLVRYDECQRGKVEHAIRMIVARTRRTYNYPATHYASSYTNANRPAMGQRLRLKSSYSVPAEWTDESKAVAYALKKYGGLVADNGGFLSFSVVPDDRFANGAFDDLRTLVVSDFEVVDTTGVDEGPRSAGKPTAEAGQDQLVSLSAGATLAGSYSAPAGTPILQWSLYEGPGSVVFSSTTVTNPMVTFTNAGAYRFILKVADGIHTPAYDATIVTVTHELRLTIGQQSTNAVINWSGANPPFLVDLSTNMTKAAWQPVRTTDLNSVTLPIKRNKSNFRVRGQP